MKKIKLAKIVILLLSGFLQACSRTAPTESDIIGKWISEDGATLKLKKDRTFEGSLLPGEYFFGQGKDYVNKKTNGSGNWILQKGQGWWELSLRFKEISGKKDEFDTQILISGSKGILSQNPPWCLFEWKGEEGGERYNFKKL
ncbi:hypothetical protein GCM10027049_03100 [Mucilaginibacter puniceus]